MTPPILTLSPAVARKQRRLNRDAQRRRRRGLHLFAGLLRATLGTSHPVIGTIDAATGRVVFRHGGTPRVARYRIILVRELFER